MSVYLFWGQEEYLLNKEIKKLKNELLDSDFISMSYKTFDNPPFIKLIECLQSAPLMFGNTLTVINVDKYLIGNANALDDKQIASIDFALANISSNVNIIFVCKTDRNENKKPDSRKKIYKTLSKYALVKEFAQYRTYDKLLPQIIANIAKEKELTLNLNTANFIIEQIGVNLTLIEGELEKLKIAVYPNKNVTPEDVKKYCVSSDDIFVLTDLLVQGNKNEIMKQYHLLTEKRHYLEVLAFVQSSMQKFIYIKNYEKRMNIREIAQKLKMHEYVAQKTQEKLRKITLDRLIEIRENLINAEYKIKSGQLSQEDVAIELALLN